MITKADVIDALILTAYVVCILGIILVVCYFAMYWPPLLLIFMVLGIAGIIYWNRRSDGY